MGKGSQQAPSGGEQRVVSLPDYADPYFKRLLQGAEEATMPFYPDDPDKYGDLAGKSTYQTYDADRLARTGDYSDITGSREMVRGIAAAGIPGMTEAMGVQREGISGIRDLAQSPTDFTASDFSATSVDPYSGFQAGSADQYTGFSRGPATAFSGFEAGSADPYSGFDRSSVEQYGGFKERTVDPFSDFQRSKAEAYQGFEAGQADPFSDFTQAEFTKAQGREFDFGPASVYGR